MGFCSLIAGLVDMITKIEATPNVACDWCRSMTHIMGLFYFSFKVTVYVINIT